MYDYHYIINDIKKEVAETLNITTDDIIDVQFFYDVVDLHEEIQITFKRHVHLKQDGLKKLNYKDIWIHEDKLVLSLMGDV